MVLLSVLYHEGKSIRRKLPSFPSIKNVASVFLGRPAPTAERDDCQPVVGTTSIRDLINDSVDDKYSHYKTVPCVLCPVSCVVYGQCVAVLHAPGHRVRRRGGDARQH